MAGMTDSFYYNCLRPDMLPMVSDEPSDIPPELPARRPRLPDYVGSGYTYPPPLTLEEEPVFEAPPPEIPERSQSWLNKSQVDAGERTHTRFRSTSVDMLAERFQKNNLSDSTELSEPWLSSVDISDRLTPRLKNMDISERSEPWFNNMDNSERIPTRLNNMDNAERFHSRVNNFDISERTQSRLSNMDIPERFQPRLNNTEVLERTQMRLSSTSLDVLDQTLPPHIMVLDNSERSQSLLNNDIPTDRSQKWYAPVPTERPALQEHHQRSTSFHYQNVYDSSPFELPPWEPQSHEFPQSAPRRYEYHQGQSGRQSSADTSMGYTDQEKNAPGGPPGLHTSYSFKEKPTRVQSVFVGASTQPIPSVAPPPAATCPPTEKPPQLQSASAQLQRRSLPTPSRAIVEEEIEQTTAARQDLLQSNITEAISHSVESLDETDSSQLPEVNNEDIQLGDLDIEEPETWSETADKKTLKKMNPKDIKRQDTIWELIQTERQYCKRLKTLQLLFRNPLLKEGLILRTWVDKMFPQLDDLAQVHMAFLANLQELQSRRPDRIIDEIGIQLYEQFSGESAEQMKVAYGVFCSGHLEAVQLYKDFFSKDRKFQAFIKQRGNHRLCVKREIPDFILMITQRPTKYPILIEAVIKGTKDKKERDYLVKALELSKEVLHNVNEQVSAAERKMRLRDIYNRLDKNSFAMKPDKKFRKQDLELNNRKLIHEGMIGLRNARGKTLEVLCVVLTDVLFFLQENNQKYSFYSPDNKYGVVPLYNLLVREKGDTKETKGMYLISQNKLKPEMYEVVFNSTSDMNKWVQCLRAASEKCPEEEEEGPSTAADEERLKAERKNERVQAIIEELRAKDKIIQKCCDAKNQLMSELVSVYNDTEDQHHSRPSSRDFEEVTVANAVGLQAAVQEVTAAAAQLSSMLQGSNSSLSRSVSSVGEYTSANFTAIPIPKRAETFAGADNSHDAARSARRKPTEGSDFNDSPQSSMYKESSDSDVSQHPDLPPLASNFEAENDSGRGSSPGCVSSISMLSPMSASMSQDQLDIGKIVKTLNNIVYMISKQSTELENLRAQLVESNEKFNKLSADGHDRKLGNKHNQLEELRNLQGVVQKEKEEWETRREKERNKMEQERKELEELRNSLSKQETDLKSQKEKLQRQIDLLRQHGQLPGMSSSPSQTSVDPATDKPDTVQSESSFVPGHRRSASAELVKNLENQSKPSVPSPLVSGRPERVPPVSKLSFSYGNKPNLPVHLLSATNEQKIGSKNVQQLPSKLLSTSSLSGGSSPPQQHGGNKATSHSNQAGIAANVSSVSLGGQNSGSQGDINKLGHSSSMGQLLNSNTSMSIPKGNWQSNRPQNQKPVGAASLSGVMKLAERGDKKVKVGSSHGLADKGPGDKEGSPGQRPKSGTPDQRNPNINHKPQKSDSDVIYF